jgi:ABC-type glycerol-3-phosphate transport system substrate-binding protein
MGALTAAGAALAGCAPQVVTKTVEVEKEVVITSEVEKEVIVTSTPEPTPGMPEEINLEFFTWLPEYAAGYEQIWNLYLADNPHVTLEITTATESTADIILAKRAGGWFPSIDLRSPINQHTYQEVVNLLDTDFPWWDRFTYDARTDFWQRYNLDEEYVPYVNYSQSHLETWVYHEDLMDEAGLDPWSVESWEDLQDLIAAGEEWVATRDDIDYFVDRGGGGRKIRDFACQMSPAYAQGHPDLQKEAIRAGNLTGADSPLRPGLEWVVEMYSNGYFPEQWWLRAHEEEFEATFVAKKSVLMTHGPWIWDKTMAADPTARIGGIPQSPPAEEGGPDNWIHTRNPPWQVGHVMDGRVLDLPEYPEIQKAFNWYHSPEAIKLRCELEGAEPIYETDEIVELDTPQWNAIGKEFYPGGKYEDVEVINYNMRAVYRAWLKEDGQQDRNWDWDSAARDLCEGTKSVDEILAWMEEQLLLNYNLPD